MLIRIMRRFSIVPLQALLLWTIPGFGQVSLFDMEPSSTDSLQKHAIRYFSPGKEGRDRVWDFSEKLYSRGSSQVMFMKDSTGVLTVSEPGRLSYYRTSSDTLILFGRESSLEKRDYTIEKVSRIFPLKYGVSVSMPFRCEGMYCGDHPFREVGVTTVKVDAEGSIVLAENNTVRNVKRVHIVDSYSVCMDLDYAALDTARLTQVIEERYEWFLPESQYPVIEDVISTTYDNMDVIGTTRYAFCNLPENQVDNYITQLDEDTPEDDEPDDSFEEESATPDIIHYEVETRGGVVTISYDLDADATINTIVASHTGMVYKHKEWTQTAGLAYTVQIDCTGLRPGIYILYINVNGKPYSEKVKL